MTLRIPTAEERPTMKPEDLCELLGMARSSIYQGIARGEIPSIRIGRRLFVPTAALRAMLQLNPTGVEFARSDLAR